MRTLTATRYAVPLREGGSLPAVVEAENTSGERDLFVVKFRGAGQGARALIAELIAGEIARALELPIPELALIELDPSFGRTERDPEIQDILKNSVGVNVGLKYLDGAFNFNPLSCAEFVTPELAADIVWLDGLTTNIDRTIRNPNLMIHERELWLIDHGAALYFHHNWPAVTEASTKNRFPMIKEHVLLPSAGNLIDADIRNSEKLSESVVAEIVRSVPDDLFMHAPTGTEPPFATANENRDAYIRYFTNRLTEPRLFLAEAAKAQEALRDAHDKALPYRR